MSYHTPYHAYTPPPPPPPPACQDTPAQPVPSFPQQPQHAVYYDQSQSQYGYMASSQPSPMGMPSLTMDGRQVDYGAPHRPSSSEASHQAPQATYAPPIRYDAPPLPPPTPRVAYEPPVFQTFQDRKRAKEMALMAQREAQMQAEAESQRRAQLLVQAQAEAQSEKPKQRPLPAPLHASSLSSSSRALPMAPGAGGMRGAPIPSMVSPRSPMTPAQAPLPPPRASSPQPPPRSDSLGASSSFASTSQLPQMPHRTPSPLPRPPRTQTLPNSPMDRPTPAGRPLPVPRPMQATIERSDTISSVKSLDLERQRPLPRPPGRVNASKSLDRGISPIAGSSGRSSRPVSLVTEEMEDLGSRLGSMGVGTSRTPSPKPRSSSPVMTMPSLSKPPIIPEPKKADPSEPAKFQPLPPPTISLPDGESSSDESEPAVRPPRSPSPGPAASFTGPPIISVSTDDTRDTAGDTSFAVPSFSFDVDEPASLPRTSTANSGAPVIQLPSLAAQPPAASSSKPTQLRPSGSAILCAHCTEPIIGRIVNAMGKRWHPQCFMCAECGENLEHVSSYESEGKAYCHLDYHEKHAHVCHHCKTPIVDPRFVTLELPELGKRYYHELHFFCAECGDPFLDPSQSSAPGTKRARQQATAEESEEEDETDEFVLHKGHPFCHRCHLRLHKPRCRACRQPIPDVALSALGAKWHQSCFVCTSCEKEFANGMFFPKDGGAFCVECFEQVQANE